MRFQKCQITREPYRRDPARRLASARKKVAQERADWGMFADQAKVKPPEEYLKEMDNGWREFARGFRHYQADLWHRCRQAIFALPPEERRAVLDGWNQNRWLPGDPTYLAEYLRDKKVEVKPSRCALDQELAEKIAEGTNKLMEEAKRER